MEIDTEAEIDLDPVTRLRALEHLTLLCPSAPSADDWQRLCGLPALCALTMRATAFATLPATAVFTEVTELALLTDDGRTAQAALHLLPRAFPKLRFVSVTGRVAPDTDLDITSPAGLRHLYRVHVGVGTTRVRGADTLPSTVEVHDLD
ncbi:hypothetical protein ACFXPW_26655 [Streptomyces goshikiensis]|uniref:hypothetical protein n=1 Tax=Streptomyces goshikiensis TaxID=1942 RepID=UPI003690F191